MSIISASTSQRPDRFYAPTTTKLVVLSLLSAGIYPAYWFYKYWQDMNASGYRKVIPWLRALVFPLFAYGCFEWINETSADNEMPSEWSAAIFTMLLIFMSLILLPLVFLPMIPFNMMAAKINKKRGAVPVYDTAITGTDIFLALLGLTFYTALYLLDVMMAQLAQQLQTLQNGL